MSAALIAMRPNSDTTYSDEPPRSCNITHTAALHLRLLLLCYAGAAESRVTMALNSQQSPPLR
jgi:hypothetical protein